MTEQEVMEVKNKSWEEALENDPWVAPAADIYETDDQFVLEAFMPGVTKENVKIKLEDGQLIIMGKVDVDSIKERKYILKESESGSYFRKLNISDSIDEEKIDASLKDGLLTVLLPKHSRLKPKTIEIN